MGNHIFFKVAALSVLTLAVAACGGDGGDGGGGGDAGFGHGNGAATQDSFFKVVSDVVASSRDDSEPRDVDAISVTTPENSEPASLDG
ncbi:hypothetical protein [Polaromonas sp.]|uniref:hypothetical protein n=1 Tax=Polaromonas sp. TaxID=1869339 RepID=UPI0018383262|nr:hypothetical protein [Polaromonas sp.]NML86427.1 hypothetical protein [Polaromonas sp.]